MRSKIDRNKSRTINPLNSGDPFKHVQPKPLKITENSMHSKTEQSDRQTAE